MTAYLSKLCTAFANYRKLLSGPLIEVALAVKTAVDSGSAKAFLVFDDATGCVIDLDLRGTKSEIIGRLSRPPQFFPGRYVSREIKSSTVARTSVSRGRGRPKLGVVAREVTLLPRHWEWLTAQPGGASAAIRRLVEEAKCTGVGREQRRAAQESAYRFMSGIAGDFPGHEGAARALFADDRRELEKCVAAWPKDIRDYVLSLAFGSVK